MTYRERTFTDTLSSLLILLTIALHTAVLYETNYCPQLIRIISNVISFTQTELFESLFIAFIATSTAFYAQKSFRKIDERKEYIKAVGKFNEAVFYTSILIENIGGNIEQLVLKRLEEEEKLYEHLKKAITEHSQPIELSLYSFPINEIAKEKNLLEKVPNLGNYPELTQAFYRTRNSMQNYNAICENRNYLIKRTLENRDRVQNPTIALQHLGEIKQRTYQLLVQSEVTLDGLIFIAEKLSEIHHFLVINLRAVGIKGIRISKLPKHPVYETLRIDLRDKLDLTLGTSRHLHIPRN